MKRVTILTLLVLLLALVGITAPSVGHSARTYASGCSPSNPPSCAGWQFIGCEMGYNGQSDVPVLLEVYYCPEAQTYIRRPSN
jgi:hypothetical protein